MSTMSTEDARHVADNPDGVFVEDLQAFLGYVGEGDKPAPQAAALWPNNEVEAIDGYTHSLTNPLNRVPALVTLRDYVRMKAKAMEARANGKIMLAVNCEQVCELHYKQLPEWARW